MNKNNKIKQKLIHLKKRKLGIEDLPYTNQYANIKIFQIKIKYKLIIIIAINKNI